MKKPTIILVGVVLCAPFFAYGQTLAKVSVTISSQGQKPISVVTGYKPKNASLVRMDVCSEADAVSIPVSRVISRVILSEKYGIYSSDVVSAVLFALQRKDVFTRARRAIDSGRDTATVLRALLGSLSPLSVGIIQGIPAIAEALLPAIGDARDLESFSRQILQDNSTIALGARGSGNDCHTGLSVALSPDITTKRIAVLE